MNTSLPKNGLVQQIKARILTRVKAGELTPEQAISELKDLQYRVRNNVLEDSVVSSNHSALGNGKKEGDALCYFAPVWQAQNSKALSESPGQSILICNEVTEATHLLHSEPLISMAMAQSVKRWLHLTKNGETSPIVSTMEDIGSAFSHYQKPNLSLHNVMILLHADTTQCIPRLCEQLLVWLQSLSKSENSEGVGSSAFGNIIVAGYGAYSRVAAQAFSGLVRSFRVEQHDIQMCVMHTCKNDTGPQIVSWMLQEMALQICDVDVRYYKGRREVLALEANEQKRDEEGAIDGELLSHDGQHLLITGGNGGIAYQLVTLCLKQRRDRITLLGRSPPSVSIQALCDQHRERLRYDRVDITQSEPLAETLANTEQYFGPIELIIHAAGSLADIPITQATKTQLDKVLQPKYQGIDTIIRHYQGRQPPNMLLFSSIAAYLPHLGQSLYACANRAMMALAAEQLPRQHLWTIHWPLWAEGGMQINDDDRELMRSEIGMLPLPTSLAWDAMLRLSTRDTLFCYGDMHKIEAFMQHSQKPLVKNTDVGGLIISESEALEIIPQVVQLLCDATGYPQEKTSLSSSLESMGLESMIITRLNVQFEKQFGRLPKTLLFDCQTVGDVVKQIQKRMPKRKPNTVKHKSFVPEAVTSESVAAKSVPASPPLNLGKVRGKHSLSDDIAIIGLSGRYPQAENINQFWELLQSGYDAIRSIPAERWSMDGFYKAEKAPGYSYAKWGSFIDNVDAFDPLFFAISPREAAAMDPQERLFLQQVWHLLEDAGYSLERLHRQSLAGGAHNEHLVGVYVGVTSGQYQQLSAQDWGKGGRILASSAYWSIANRVSYFLNIHEVRNPISNRPVR